MVWWCGSAIFGWRSSPPQMRVSFHFSHQSHWWDTDWIGYVKRALLRTSQYPNAFCPISKNETEPTAGNVYRHMENIVHRRDAFRIHLWLILMLGETSWSSARKLICVMAWHGIGWDGTGSLWLGSAWPFAMVYLVWSCQCFFDSKAFATDTSLSWNFSHRCDWWDTYSIGDTSLAPLVKSQRALVSAQCRVMTLSLLPVRFATHAWEVAHRWNIFVLHAWLIQKL